MFEIEQFSKQYKHNVMYQETKTACHLKKRHFSIASYSCIKHANTLALLIRNGPLYKVQLQLPLHAILPVSQQQVVIQTLEKVSTKGFIQLCTGIKRCLQSYHRDVYFVPALSMVTICHLVQYQFSPIARHGWGLNYTRICPSRWQTSACPLHPCCL